MREVTIPNDYNPFRLEVNGRIYSYKAGTTQSVPDEVAELIDKYNKSKPVPKQNSIIDNSGLSFQKTDADKVLKVKEDGSDVEWAEGGGGSGSDLPEYTAADAGKVLAVNEDGTGVKWSEGGSGALFVNVNATFDEDEEIVSLILDKTWAQINGALRAGTAVFFASVNEGFINGYTFVGLNAGRIGLRDSNGYVYDLFVDSENDYPEYTLEE